MHACLKNYNRYIIVAHATQKWTWRTVQYSLYMKCDAENSDKEDMQKIIGCSSCWFVQTTSFREFCQYTVERVGEMKMNGQDRLQNCNFNINSMIIRSSSLCYYSSISVFILKSLLLSVFYTMGYLSKSRKSAFPCKSGACPVWEL